LSVIAGMIGLPEADFTSFHRWAVELISITLDWERGVAASRKLRGLFAPVLAERRREPREDLLSVLAHADQLGAVRRYRSLVPQAIEEALRWESPLLGIMRTTTRAVELGGVSLPEGAVVNVNLGAANRDPARWERP